VGGVFAAILFYPAALGYRPPRALAVTPTLPFLLVGHPLGAAFAALLGQLSGGTFAKGADVGADVGAREMGLDDDDPQNPATIAELAGDCAGDCAARATLALGSSAVLDVGAMLALGAVFAGDSGLKSALALTLLPILGRAFSVLGAAFGAFVVRTDDREGPVAPFVRGQVVATALHAVGTAGAAWWLVPERATPLLAAGAVGVALAASLALLTHYQTLSRFRPVRDLADASRAGSPLTLTGGFAAGLDAAVVPLGLVAIALVLAHAIGRAWGGPAGEALALAALGLGLAGSGGFGASLEAAATIADAASGIVELTVGRDRRDVRGRLLVLDTTGNSFETGSRIGTATLALVVAPLYVGALTRLASPHGASTVALSGLGPYVAAVAGVGLVGWLFARSLAGVARCARRVLEEVRRQLRDRPSPDPASRALRRASGAPPDYGPCIETTSRFALRHMVLPGLSAVGIPTLLSLVLRLSESGDKGEIAVGSVASLIVAATVAGVLGALLSASAGGAWGNAKKYIVTGAHGGPLLVDETGARAENPTFYAAVVGDTVGDPMKDAAVPAVLVLIHMLPVLALVLLPLFW
jgi:K(+)-stimulated pyrophosphate-energized sodium pump